MLIVRLRRIVNAESLEDARTIGTDALERAERLKKTVLSAPVKSGRKGGSKTAERGPDYFRQIAAMRKTRGGGRPKKES